MYLIVDHSSDDISGVDIDGDESTNHITAQFG